MQDMNKVHSVCLGCNARCGIRFHIRNGRIEGVTGNPYHPYNMLGRQIPFETPIKKGLKATGSLCGKARDVKSYVYNPRRVLTPLKRAGRRGEGKFEPISWETLIREIAFGGTHFSHLGEERHVPGLKDLLDDSPLDPKAPELGPKANGLCFMTGRLQPGRKEFIDRFVKCAFGSINRIGHTDICGIGFRMGNLAFTNGKEVELKADPWSARYIIVFGANVYEALQPGVNTYGATLAKRYSEDGVKFVIVDPRAQKASVHAHRWISIIPGQDGAFAMGIMRWLIEKGTFNKEFLKCPNLEAANRLGNGGFVNATHLVIWDETHPRDRALLRWNDLFPGKDDSFVVISDKTGDAIQYNRAKSAILDVDTTLSTQGGKRRVRVRSSFNILKEEVMKYTLKDYGKLCGVEPDIIKEVAEEFSRYAPYSAVCQYHGAGNYVNGTYSAYAVALLNAFSGSLQRQGGYCSSGGHLASYKKGPYDLVSFPGKKRPRGVKISREKAHYEDTTEFRNMTRQGRSPYPSKRPWFPFTKGGLSVEALSGIDQAYPYPIKALFLYFYNPVYSTPGGKRYEETLRDTEKVPLLVSIDIGINESNIYADYIIPDVTYAEGHYGWLPPHAPCQRFTAIRTPAIEPLTHRTPDGRPIMLETFLIDLAEALDLPGFGKDAIPDATGRLHPLKQAEDFYLRGFANIAHNADVTKEDKVAIEFVERNYPVARYKGILKDDEWKKVCGVLARGGLFSPYDKQFHGEIFMSSTTHFYMYNERLSRTISSTTGRRLFGSVTYTPPLDLTSPDYPLRLISFKRALHTQSRTIWHKTALELHPTNFVLMNRKDAKRLGLRDGDEVVVRSRSCTSGKRGRVKVTGLIREGVVAISISYGHTQLGASRVVIKGINSYAIPDPRLGMGINPNDLALLDPKYGYTPYVDEIGGIPDFSSSAVRVERA